MGDSSDEAVEDAVVADIVNQPVIKPKREIFPVNNILGLQAKLNDIQLNLDWIEKLDIAVDAETIDPEESKENPDSQVDNDFQRESSFYNQALTAVSKAFKRLRKLGIPTKRPNDYFAEMAKSDAHMLKVREKLLSKQTAVERAEKVRNIREQKKLGKKMQQEIIQQRKQEKKKMINAIKKTKKGKMSADKLLNEKKPTGDRKNKGKKQRDFRDSKYGYGGKKKGLKHNTAESSAVESRWQENKSTPFNRTPKRRKPQRRRR